MQLYFSIGKRCRRKANWSPYVPIYKIFPKRIILLKFDDIRYCTNSGWLHLFFREWPDVRKIEIEMNKIKLYQWFKNFWNDKDINLKNWKLKNFTLNSYETVTKRGQISWESSHCHLLLLLKFITNSVENLNTVV